MYFRTLLNVSNYFTSKSLQNYKPSKLFTPVVLVFQVSNLLPACLRERLCCVYKLYLTFLITAPAD